MFGSADRGSLSHLQDADCAAVKASLANLKSETKETTRLEAQTTSSFINQCVKPFSICSLSVSLSCDACFVVSLITSSAAAPSASPAKIKLDESAMAEEAPLYVFLASCTQQFIHMSKQT